MNVLGFDTSTAVSAACVLRSDESSYEVIPPPERLSGAPGHARELMPAVASCLEQAGIGFADLDAIAVGVGPGAFTGLRIGITTARALALANDTELRPVSSLWALAAEAGEDLALPLIDAKRGEVFSALLQGGEELWPAVASSPETLAARVRHSGLNPLALGDGSLRFREVLDAAGVRVAPAGSSTHVVRGLSICRLAADVDPSPPGAVLPDYLRLPDAKQR